MKRDVQEIAGQQRDWIGTMNAVFPEMMIGIASCAADAYACEHMFDIPANPNDLIRRMAREVNASLRYADIRRDAEAASARYDRELLTNAIEILETYAEVLAPDNAKLLQAANALSDVLGD